MTRYFVGIQIPRQLRERLALLRGNLPAARWVDPDDYHLTLRFVGDADGPGLTSLADNLARIDCDPFALQPGEPGTFGHGKTRAIWIGVEGSSVLAALQGQVDHVARGAGFPPDHRKFTPHITLARLSRGKPAAVAEAMTAIGNPLLAPFDVDQFVLFSSGRSRGGGPYAVEDVFPLGNIADGI